MDDVKACGGRPHKRSRTVAEVQQYCPWQNRLARWAIATAIVACGNPKEKAPTGPSLAGFGSRQGKRANMLGYAIPQVSQGYATGFVRC